MGRRRIKRRNTSTQPDWLPIDIRLLPPLFSFQKVTGIAKVFLIAEVILAVGVVLGTVLLLLLTLAT